MSAICRNLLSTYHPFVTSTFRTQSKCLFIKKYRLDLCNFKHASTAKFPGLTKDHPYINNHDDLHKFSIEHPEQFWDFQANDILTWHKPYTSNRIMDCDMEKGHFRWFDDGQLNASINCVDRYVAQES